MSRKWSVLAVTMLSSALLAAGLSAAQDDDKESPLGKIMTKVQKSTTAIRNATRNPVNFKKANNGKDVAKHADEIVKLGKEAKEFKDALKNAKDEKDPQAKWNELMDAMIKSAEDVGKATNQAQAKAEFGKMNKACGNCHTVFRVEEEGFK